MSAPSLCPACGKWGRWGFDDDWCHDDPVPAMNCPREGWYIGKLARPDDYWPREIVPQVTGFVSEDALTDLVETNARLIGNAYPDGVHTCAELQKLEPGRRPCTCGRCLA